LNSARFGAQEIPLAAKSLGFKARAAALSLKDIDNTILPVLGRDISGEWFIRRLIEFFLAPLLRMKDESLRER
jgi:hypothetical protein